MTARLPDLARLLEPGVTIHVVTWLDGAPQEWRWTDRRTLLVSARVFDALEIACGLTVRDPLA